MQSADHHIVSDVELPPLVEQRLFDVLLYDIRLFCSIEVLFFLF